MTQDSGRFQSSVLAELDWRGFIKQYTHDELDEALEAGSQTLYCGFDPTSDSLHAGSLMPIIGLAHFRRHGHDPIALVGGATGLIGDPSGKDTERQLLDQERLQRNVAGIRAQIRVILDRALELHAEHAPTPDAAQADPVPIVNNADWMLPHSYVGFLRDVGKHFRVNHMIARDSVRDRLESREQGISYTEFSYMIIQAYDFLHLWRERGCRVQAGGSDQWGNITAGTDLIRRVEGEPAFGLTFPLLTDSQGKKYGKSVDGAIWLDPERTSPYRFYQYWYGLGDDDMPALLRTFTFLPRERVDELCELIERDENRNDVQEVLAEEVTRLVHGEEGLARAQYATRVFFGEEIEDLSDRELMDIFDDVPSTEIARERLAQGVGVIDLFAETGLQSSKGAARRLLDQGGGYVNNRRVEDRDYTVTLEDLASASALLLRSGKRTYHLVKVVGS